MPLDQQQETMLTQIRKMKSIIDSSSNPNKMMELMANNNPKLKEILETVKSTNSDPRILFYEKAKEKGMTDQDIKDFLNTLKSL